MTYETKGIIDLVDDSSVCVLALCRPSHSAFSPSSPGHITAFSLFTRPHCCALSFHFSPDCIVASCLFPLLHLVALLFPISPFSHHIAHVSCLSVPLLCTHSLLTMNSANTFFPTFILKSVWRLIGSLASNTLFNKKVRSVYGSGTPR